jgi:hypothetical protein
MHTNHTNAYHCAAAGWEQWTARPTNHIKFIRAASIPTVIKTVNVNVTPQEVTAVVAFLYAQSSNTTEIGIDANGLR